MKTLLLTEVFPPRTGGSGRWFWEVYRRLPREEVFVVAGESPGHQQFDATHDLNQLRMPLSFTTWGIASPAGLRQYGKTVWKLRRLIAAEGIGQVHCGKCLPEGLLAWLLKKWRGLSYLVYVHGEELNLASMSRELGWLTRRVLHGAQTVIANSRNSERILRDEWGLPPDQVRVLHPGVDTEHFVPAPRETADRERLGWGERPVVLTVGRLQKRKGHDQLIRALSAIRKAIPDVLYVIVGEGEERADLEKLVRDEGLAEHVRFHGELTDGSLLRCYQQCDLFVLPNRQVGKDIEGFGMVLLEAQACGKPVVAGASGGTAETMRIPETGLVVPCDGPNELAAVVTELLNDPGRCERMGQAGREWVVEQFDWQALCRQARELFGGEARTGALCGAGIAP